MSIPSLLDGMRVFLLWTVGIVAGLCAVACVLMLVQRGEHRD